MKPIFYSKEDVLLAEWVIQTKDTLNQGLPTILWAWKVVKWYSDFYSVLRIYRKKHPKITLQAVITILSNRIKRGDVVIGIMPDET